MRQIATCRWVWGRAGRPRGALAGCGGVLVDTGGGALAGSGGDAVVDCGNAVVTCAGELVAAGGNAVMGAGGAELAESIGNAMAGRRARLAGRGGKGLAGRRGNALVEFALIAPLLFPILLVIFDFGMYTYAFVSVQNAARSAAMRNSGGPESAVDQQTACAIVIEELRGLPNIGSGFQTACGSSPLVVTSIVCDQTIPCRGTTTSADGEPAVSVTVTYTPPALFRVPFAGPGTIVRNAQMKVRNSE